MQLLSLLLLRGWGSSSRLGMTIRLDCLLDIYVKVGPEIAKLYWIKVRIGHQYLEIL